MQMQLAAAIRFVQARGAPVEQARLSHLLDGARPAPAIAAMVFADQRPDGGWAPFWARDYSSLDATCFRLAQAESAGLLLTEAGHRALDLLARRQSKDGSWHETPPDSSALPPWLAPADPGTSAYLTANCALWLTIRASDAAASRRGAAYLSAQPPATLTGGPPHSAWLAAALWYACDQPGWADTALRQLAADHPQLTASALAWALTSLEIAGVPADHWFVLRSIEQLRAYQRDDGGWSSADGAERDVHVTLEAIRALRRLVR